MNKGDKFMDTNNPSNREIPYVDELRISLFNTLKVVRRFPKKNGRLVSPPEIADLDEDPEMISREMKYAMDMIDSAQHFAVSNRGGLANLLGDIKISDIPERLRSLHARLPYPEMTLSFHSWMVDDLEEGKEVSGLARDGDGTPTVLFLNEVRPDLLFITSWTRCNPIVKTISWSNWICAAHPMFISLSGDFCDRKDVREIGEELFQDPEFFTKSKTNIYVLGEETASEAQIYMECLLVLFPFLICLNTKGITTHTIRPPKKRKSHQMHLPTVEYKVLKIGPTASSSTYSSVPKPPTDEKKRLHMCRGHIKNYNDSRPLFGRVTGSFFFSPHWRGDKERGILLKDYTYVSTKGSKKRCPTLKSKKENIWNKIGHFFKSIVKPYKIGEVGV